MNKLESTELGVTQEGDPLVNQTYRAEQHKRLVADIDAWHQSGTDMSLDAYLIEVGWRKG
jgi:hypothetical protein